jgi:hypothetical protein
MKRDPDHVRAAASLLGIVIDILTVKATKSAIEGRSHHLTARERHHSDL